MKACDTLAIDGGLPVRTNCLPPWPHFDQTDIHASVDVLKSGKVNYWTGDEGKNFEQEFSRFVSCEYGIALANGTVALELALVALDIGPGDEVITSCRTFIASASAIFMRGATPVLADVDRDSQNLTAETVAPLVTSRTKAVIAVHLAGWPVEMEPLLALAKQEDFVVIEDCAQAHGATYQDQPVGSLGALGAFSFCQDKIMTTGGEGGMLTTNDLALFEKAWSFKDHGKSYEAVYHRDHPPGFRWLHESFGTNWRLTEMQAAIGRSVLKKLPDWVKARQKNAQNLANAFSKLPALRVPLPPDHIEHSYYKFYAFIRPEALKTGWDRDRIMTAVNAEGIPCFSGICPDVSKEGAFRDASSGNDRYEVAREIGEQSLMFMVHPTLTPADIEDTITAISKVLQHAQR